MSVVRTVAGPRGLVPPVRTYPVRRIFRAQPVTGRQDSTRNLRNETGAASEATCRLMGEEDGHKKSRSKNKQTTDTMGCKSSKNNCGGVVDNNTGVGVGRGSGGGGGGLVDRILDRQVDNAIKKIESPTFQKRQARQHQRMERLMKSPGMQRHLNHQMNLAMTMMNNPEIQRQQQEMLSQLSKQDPAIQQRIQRHQILAQQMQLNPQTMQQMMTQMQIQQQQMMMMNTTSNTNDDSNFANAPMLSGEASQPAYNPSYSAAPSYPAAVNNGYQQ